MNLRERLLSEKNIFQAIYTVDSYIQNKDLLDKEDAELLEKLKDVFNCTIISDTVKRIRDRLRLIIDDDSEHFTTTVYFKPKKYKDGYDVFRPLHTAKLIDQIAITAMLQILVFEVNENSELVPSELSRLIPSNFYGNRISYDGQELFKPWQSQYQQYTAKANDILYSAEQDQRYLYEVTLDLENFFPSIDFYNFGDEALDKLMLTDGITCHETAKRKLELYAANSSTPDKPVRTVKPFMLVVCKDTAHAAWVEDYIRSDEFRDGAYRNKTIVVHSKQKGAESEANTRLLLDCSTKAKWLQTENSFCPHQILRRKTKNKSPRKNQ